MVKFFIPQVLQVFFTIEINDPVEIRQRALTEKISKY
jgi:hypothetical protein